MAFARTRSVALVGVEGHVVEVEAHLAQGLPKLTVVGLPDTSVHEARDRVRAAVVNTGIVWPQRRITVGLSPATLPKSGSALDLAMAVAVLGAAEVVPVERLAGLALLGELGLDGRVRPLAGVLPAVLAVAAAGIDHVVVPAGNRAEAALVPGVHVHAVGSLRALLDLLVDGTPPPVDDAATLPAPRPRSAPLDLCDVAGQPQARHALEVAAAGGHHLFLLGPPGAGKTMLAERLPGLLPTLTPAQALEVSAIHSVAGTLPPGSPLMTVPPYRDPHHTASVAALVGGGSVLARPGETSLAHRGVLFLDEAPEFSTRVLDALRQPLESGEVVIARSGGTVRYPARFCLVLAANPCSCARPGQDGRLCECSPTSRRRYRARLSGPLLDRVDIRVELFALTRGELLATGGRTEASGVVAARVRGARQRAERRLSGTPWRQNAEIPGRELRGRFALPGRAVAPAGRALEHGALSARGFDRVLRVAWTLADLAGADRPDAEHVSGALGLRLPGYPVAA